MITLSKYKTIIFVVIIMILIFLSGLFLAPKIFNNDNLSKENIENVEGYVVNNKSSDIINDNNKTSNDNENENNPKEDNNVEDNNVEDNTVENKSEEVSFINDEIRDEYYKKFVEDYVPEYTPIEIDKENREKLDNKLEDVDFTEMSLSFSNFIWWLYNMFPNVITDFSYSAEIDRETHFIIVTYDKQDEELFQKNKELMTNWILKVSQHSFFHTKFGTNIKYISK